MALFTSPSGRAYEQVLFDDFSGSDINGKIWERCPEMKRQDIGGMWKNEMAEVHGGNLWLWAKIAEDGTPVSGAVRSKGLFEQAFGYFECRMMLQRTTGFWGAFWMMCGDVFTVDGSGVNGSELDIIESGDCLTKGVNHAIHWDGYGEQHKSLACRMQRPELYEGWHTYALEWTPEEYIWYIDGEETWRSDESGVCTKQGYMLLSTEFGSWAAPVVEKDLPDCCRVDYVRVYTEAKK